MSMTNPDNRASQGSIDEVSLEQRIEELVERKVTARFAQLQATVAETLSQNKLSTSPQSSNRASLFVFSGDLDRLQVAFIIATGAAAMGQEVSMFFSFWGLSALKKQSILPGKNLPEKMLALMLPVGPDKGGLSKLNMLGMGPLLL